MTEATLDKKILANVRPQPAIPSAIVFFLSMIWPIMFADPDGLSAPFGNSFAHYLIALGLVVSVGLAIAAGFCSLFPQALWIVLALWGLSLIDRNGLPPELRNVLGLGIVLAVFMIGFQLWRILTQRFVPTLE